jgi:hypothetical protein
MSLATEHDGKNFRLVGVPYDETFDSQETLRCIQKAFGLWGVSRIESITLLGRQEAHASHSFGSASCLEGNSELPLNMRPVDLELEANGGLRSVVFRQGWTWVVKTATDKQPREHE